MYLLKQLFHI